MNRKTILLASLIVAALMAFIGVTARNILLHVQAPFEGLVMIAAALAVFLLMFLKYRR